MMDTPEDDEPFISFDIDGQAFVSHVQNVTAIRGLDIDGTPYSIVNVFGNARGSLEYIRIGLESRATSEPLSGDFELIGERNEGNDLNFYMIYALDPDDVYLNGYENTNSELIISSVGYEEGDWVTGTFSAVLKAENRAEYKTVTNGNFRLQIEE